jgi:hypothetical protein
VEASEPVSDPAGARPLTVRVQVTVQVGGWGPAGEGMTAELIGALRAAGFEGWPERNAMYRVTGAELTAEAAVVLAASWLGSAAG